MLQKIQKRGCFALTKKLYKIAITLEVSVAIHRNLDKGSNNGDDRKGDGYDKDKD
jgi:hypothetical protein